MNRYNVGQSFTMFDGSTVTIIGVRTIPQYIGGETHTRAGREGIRIRMNDAVVYDCEMDGVRYTNSERDMHALATSL